MSSWLILGAIATRELFAQTKGRGRLLAAGVLTLLVADAGGTNLLYYEVNNGNRLDWRGAFSLINERSRRDDVCVAWWTQFGPYYLNREVITWEDLAPETVLESGNRFWFVVDSETARGNLRMKEWVEKNAELVDFYYLRLPDEASLRIYFYDSSMKKDSAESE
jgi:hypothetical protein